MNGNTNRQKQEQERKRRLKIEQIKTQIPSPKTASLNNYIIDTLGDPTHHAQGLLKLLNAQTISLSYYFPFSLINSLFWYIIVDIYYDAT